MTLIYTIHQALYTYLQTKPGIFLHTYTGEYVFVMIGGNLDVELLMKMMRILNIANIDIHVTL